MALAWFGIFIIVMLAIGLSRENGLQAGWAKVRSLLGDDEQRISGGMVRIRKSADGHFWATARIDGIERRLLIDSGATTTSLSLATAHAASLDLDQNPFPTTLSTANGMVFARTSSVHRLELGPIVASDLRVVVAPEFGDTDVLGMNFLSRLKAWRVEGDMLVLEPKA
ncbi:TIGR02281 family clan AA aspartic protease [Sphingomonas sp. MMS24-J13]|uniref:retropepsin-like aspartic protease family protein n=1 Tax=Sphingomonas sp. MMS24-J13 TaxID=3238686 RepID=UPI003851255C